MSLYIYQALMFFRKEKVEEFMHVQTGRIIAIYDWFLNKM